MEMHRLDPRTSVPEALRAVLSRIRPVERTELLAVPTAAGRVAAEDVTSRVPVPAFPCSHVDGYAVRTRDLKGVSATRPVNLRMVGAIHAGECFPRALAAGETVAIATGAPVPHGADAVEMFENVDATGRIIQFSLNVVPGENVDPAGGDLALGTRIVTQGTPLTPALIGLLSLAGYGQVRVYARPVVGVLSSGNELRPPGPEPLPYGKVFEANSAALSALIEPNGGVPKVLPPVRDVASVLERALRRALAASDMVVVSGGSSVGERDLLHTVLPRVGTVLFHGVKVRPGMPTIAAESGGKVILGMPGHPASCLSNALWLLVPAVRKLSHLPGDGTSRVRVRMARDTPLHGHGFSTVVPLRIQGETARSTFHGSHFITSLHPANGYAILPPAKRHLRQGESIYARRALFLGGA